MTGKSVNVRNGHDRNWLQRRTHKNENTVYFSPLRQRHVHKAWHHVHAERKLYLCPLREMHGNAHAEISEAEGRTAEAATATALPAQRHRARESSTRVATGTSTRYCSFPRPPQLSRWAETNQSHRSRLTRPNHWSSRHQQQIYLREEREGGRSGRAGELEGEGEMARGRGGGGG